MLSTGRILAIEDDPDTRANLCDILELDGYEVETAGGLCEALDRNDWSEYSAILLDRRLPDGTAEELLPSLSKLAPDAAVIVVTAHTDFEATIVALRHGVADYLLKPVDPEALRSTLNRIGRVRKAEERAQQVERLAAIGEMMTVLAHESRNAFQLAGANLDMLTMLLEGSPDGRQLVERVRKQQTRVSRLFEDVRGYAAPIQIDRGLTDMAAAVRNTADEFRALHSDRNVRIDVVCETELPVQTFVDTFRIDQVFRNLLDNSLSAITGPVEVSIACAKSKAGTEPVIEIRYRDNGPGLTPECRQRLFEPFFTTKAKGTGLGMAITQRIIEAHSGRIEVLDPIQGTGASFLITLPATPGDSEAEA